MVGVKNRVTYGILPNRMIYPLNTYSTNPIAPVRVFCRLKYLITFYYFAVIDICIFLFIFFDSAPLYLRRLNSETIEND